MTRRLLVAVLLLLAPALGRAGEPKSVRVFAAQPDYYPFVTQLSLGPTHPRGEGDGTAGAEQHRSRIAVVVSDQGNAVFLEDIREGDRGCCKKLERVGRLDLSQLAQLFQIDGNPADFTVTGWTSWSSFRFTISGRSFLASVRTDTEMLISEQ